MHETKQCPRCGKSFECKAGSITICQCFAVHLTPEESDAIKKQYEDCLCVDCLRELQNMLQNPSK
jgi:hypothetical protein